MNKKLIIIGTILTLALFISACQPIGARIKYTGEVQPIQSGVQPKECFVCSSSNVKTYYFEKEFIRFAHGKTITLIDVGSTGAVVVSVSGVQDVIGAGAIKIINGVQIQNNWSFYPTTTADKAAELAY